MKTKEGIKTAKPFLTWLDNGCYPGYVMFSHGLTYKQLVKQLRKNKIAVKDGWLDAVKSCKQKFIEKSLFGRALEIVNNKDKHLYVIFLYRKFNFNDWDIIHLAHEVTHICQFYLAEILDRNRETEAEAYYHTHLMTQCMRELRDAQHKHKKNHE